MNSKTSRNLGERASVTVSAQDATANIGQLLDRVEQGEAIVITRHGEPIARLVPFVATIDAPRVRRAIDGILAIQQTQALGDRSIEDLLHDGHTP